MCYYYFILKWIIILTGRSKLMGIIDSYKKQLEDAKEARDTIRNLPDDLQDKSFLIMMLEENIKKYESRLMKLTSLGAEIQCNECNKWVTHEDTDTMTEVDNLFLCTDCQNTINKVLMTNEAESKWNLPSGTIKQDCRRGMLDTYIEKGLIRRSGKYWLIHELVGKLYYKKKQSDNN